MNVARLRSSTINQRLQAIRCLCRWAERQGFLKSNPAAVVKSLRVAKRRRPTGLTEPEVHGLLRVAGESKRGRAKRNYGLLQLLLQTGLRVGELTAMNQANSIGIPALISLYRADGYSRQMPASRLRR